MIFRKILYDNGVSIINFVRFCFNASFRDDHSLTPYQQKNREITINLEKVRGSTRKCGVRAARRRSRLADIIPHLLSPLTVVARNHRIMGASYYN